MSEPVILRLIVEEAAQIALLEVVPTLITPTVPYLAPPGQSAYELAVSEGFDGTEQEWIASLVGKSAYQIAIDNGYTGTEEEWVAMQTAFLDWQASYFTEGEKLTYRDAGILGQFSYTNDYLYVCVRGGDENDAIWKKAVLFQSI